MTKLRQGIFYAIVGAIFGGASGTIAQGLFSRIKLSLLWLVGACFLRACYYSSGIN